MKKIIIWIICIVILATIVMYAIDMSRMKNNKPVIFSTWGYSYAPPAEVDTSKTPHSFTRTYQVLNIAESDDENYLHLTIKRFQIDEVETVKVEKNLASMVEVNKYYEFTFENTNNKLEDNIKSIFENTILKQITETDKTGLEQVQDVIKLKD